MANKNIHTKLYLDECSTMELEASLQNSPSVVILPLGSVEPHGPHLPLSTDRLLSVENALRATKALRGQSVNAWLAPALPYGVTEYAQGFCGAISLSQTLYEQILVEVSEQYLQAGFSLVCWINHHLEPQQIAAIQNASKYLNVEESIKVVAPSVISRRWGRALGAEFKSGACHAGEYEGSMVLCSNPSLVQRSLAEELPTLEISLSDAIRQGKSGFLDVGMNQAYTGSPSTASVEEGERLYQAHTHMVVTEILEILGLEG